MVILAKSLEERERAQNLSLNYPVVTEKPQEGYYLEWSSGQWVVRHSGYGERFQLGLDFHQELSRLKRQGLNPKKDLLSRALGFKKGMESPLVWDGTMGFGKDSLHMLALGFRVTSFERQPLVYLLMAQALEAASELKSQWQIRSGDVIQSLLDSPSQLMALYLDPMFESVQKKSAAKKNMEFLRQLTGEVSSSGQELVAAALKSPVSRVVVKRPLGAEPLVKKPNQQIRGRLIRYDIYLKS